MRLPWDCRAAGSPAPSDPMLGLRIAPARTAPCLGSSLSTRPASRRRTASSAGAPRAPRLAPLPRRAPLAASRGGGARASFLSLERPDGHVRRTEGAA